MEVFWSPTSFRAQSQTLHPEATSLNHHPPRTSPHLQGVPQGSRDLRDAWRVDRGSGGPTATHGVRWTRSGIVCVPAL